MQTVVLKIKIRLLNRDKESRLDFLAEQFTACVRFHLVHIVRLRETNATIIHHACYRKAKELFSLTAATIQQARDKAIASYRSYLARKKRGHRCGVPRFRKALPLRIPVQGLRVFVEKSVARVSTLEGYIWLPLMAAESIRERMFRPHAVSEVVNKGGERYLMLAVKMEDVPRQNGERPHFGLDLGLANLAVLSGPKNVEFFGGKALRFIRGKFFRYRQSLQKKRKIGMVKRSKGRESRWVCSENHRISRGIINIVSSAGGVLHVEKLTGIRDSCKGTAKINRMIHGWPFAQLLSFIKYKAVLAGVTVAEEDPRYTSQRCSRCGYTARSNRSKQASFCCGKCGFRLHADLNAARNLAAKGACPLGVPGVTPGKSSDWKRGSGDSSPG